MAITLWRKTGQRIVCGAATPNLLQLPHVEFAVSAVRTRVGALWLPVVNADVELAFFLPDGVVVLRKEAALWRRDHPQEETR